MPEAEGSSSTALPPSDVAPERLAAQMGTSPKLVFPTMAAEPAQVQGPALSSSSSSNSILSKHSHTRSRSVNLSPTMGTAGPAFRSTASRQESFSPDQQAGGPSTLSSMSYSPHGIPYMPTIARSGSPLLRPSSPLYMNVQGSASSSIPSEHWRASPGYASSESGSSEGSSPEGRRGLHLARSMERSSSSGSVGSNSSHLTPHSPRSGFRRTASPSRAYAVPLSPRLQAFGGHSPHHTRKLSGGSFTQAADPMMRPTSPLTIDPDPDLPIDSVWPGASGETGSSTGSEAIPIGVGRGHSTPIPPSLRDDLSTGHQGTGMVTVLPGPSSPGRRSSASFSPQEHFTYRDQRTPSPSGWSARRERRASGSSSSSSSALAGRTHSSPGSLPALAAPKPIAKRSFHLDSAPIITLPHLSAPRRHHRTLSNSSSGSTGSDKETGDDLSASSNEKLPSQAHDLSPTQKILSPAGGAHVKLNAQNVLAEVNSVQDSLSEEDSSGGSTGNLLKEDDEGEPMSSMTPTSSSGGLDKPNSSDVQRDYNAADSTSGSSGLQSGIQLTADGELPSRVRSPAISSPHLENVPLGESPPKTRSFIGMPPRSGYDLSDDPDDVGSEDGSTGSGRESTNEDRDDNEDEEDMVDSGDLVEDDYKDRDRSEEESQPITTHLRPVPIKRPSLLHSVIVPPIPDHDQSVEYKGGEPMQWAGENQRRADLALTRDEGIDSEEEDEEEEKVEVDVSSDASRDGQEGNEQGQGSETQDVEESLSILERIFLFAKSEMAYHRVLVSRSLADWLLEVELSDAVEFVIPLLNGLACDEPQVCTAFAPHLHRVMWHFFRNCPLVEDERPAQSALHLAQEEEDNRLEKATRPNVSVSVFTPLLCALLLNYDATIASTTQASIVRFFARLQGSDFPSAEEEGGPEEEQPQEETQQFSSGRAQVRETFDMDTALIRDAAAREEKRVSLEEYSFDQAARELVMDELLNHVALAIGSLNVEQTTHAREMTSQQQPQGDNTALRQEGEDATMDEVILVDRVKEATNSASSNDEFFEDELSQKEEGNDLEMSMDMMEEGFGSDDQSAAAIAATSASMDNVSVTMSDVEEEVAVGRMASISLLAALGVEELVQPAFLVERIVPEMLRLSTDPTFFVRKEVAVAMGALAKSIGYKVIQQKDLLKIFELFCRDNIWHVRQAACLSFPNVFNQVQDAKTKREKVVEVMRIFVGDVSRNVRVAALDIIGEMIYLFHRDPDGVPPELVRHFLGESYDLPVIGEVATAVEGEEKEAKVSKDETQHSLHHSPSLNSQSQQQPSHGRFAGNWGGLPPSISNGMDPSGWSSEGHSIPPYGAPNGDFLTDPDRPLVMAYNFPAVILTLGKEHWPRLRTVHSRLYSNSSSKVRRSLAASLHEVAKIIGEEWTSEDLFDTFQQFLDSQTEKDEHVKMAMLQNLDVFMEHLTLPKALESLKFLLRLWNEEGQGDSARFACNWRLREKLISLIPNLAKRYLLEDDEGVMVVLMQSALTDAVSSVRIQAVKVVSSLYHIFGEHDQVLADGFLGMLVDVGENESYRGRVACLHCLAELCKSRLPRSSVEMLMMNRLIEMCKDDVVDVRIAVAQVVSLMCRIDELYAMPRSRSQDFVLLLQRLSHDEAGVVRDVILPALAEDDPGREAPPVKAQAELEQRPPRQLVLGPSDGGPHRLPSANRSFDMNGNSTGLVQSFAMDEEEDGEALNDRNTRGIIDGQPRTNAFFADPLSMQDSAVIKRRFMVPHQQQQDFSGFLEADASMFEDADDDDEEEDEEQNTAKVNGRLFSSGSDFLMLTSSSGADEKEEQIGNDSLEEEPHHLLGISSDEEGDEASQIQSSSKRYPAETSSDDNNRHLSSQHTLSLESPERPWSTSGNSIAHQKSSQHGQAAVSPASKRAADPFLAFVADKRFDEIGSGVHNPEDPSLRSPSGGQRQKLADE